MDQQSLGLFPGKTSLWFYLTLVAPPLEASWGRWSVAGGGTEGSQPLLLKDKAKYIFKGGRGFFSKGVVVTSPKIVMKQPRTYEKTKQFIDLIIPLGQTIRQIYLLFKEIMIIKTFIRH